MNKILLTNSKQKSKQTADLLFWRSAPTTFGDGLIDFSDFQGMCGYYMFIQKEFFVEFFVAHGAIEDRFSKMIFFIMFPIKK